MIKTSCVISQVSPRLNDRKKKFKDFKDWSRIEEHFVRISFSLNNIILSLDSVSKILEDLEEDPAKAAKKQLEFSTRFTRNYLCELRQKMNEIRKILEHYENKSSRIHQNIFSCFILSFQTANQAFQNVEKNLRYVIFNKIPIQIAEFLTCFGDLCFIANAAYWDGVGGKLLELEDLNTALINKLRVNEDSIRKAELQKKEKQLSLLKIKNEVKKRTVVRQQNKQNTLSMYKSSQVTAFEKLWKRKTKALAQSRFGKVEFQIKNDKNEEESLKADEEVGKNENFDKIKEAVINEVKLKRKIIPVPENEMETMVQCLAARGVTSGSDDDNELVLDRQTPGDRTDRTDVTVEQSETLLEPDDKFQMGPVLDEAFKTMFSHIMSQVIINIDPDKKETEADLAVRNRIAEEVRRSHYREDNVKLICIVEDESKANLSKVQDTY